VLGFFCQRVSDPHQAADLTAETFAKALLGCHRFRYEDGNAVGWLMGIARHELSGTYRKQRNGKQALQRLGIGHISLDDDSLERIERLIDVESQIVGLRVALEELPKGLRAAVTLRVGHDLSFREVARQLGCSVPAARVRVSRGMSRLTEAVCA
jgi:RNA polymerase sigma-70 factor (ECF subfamily)